MADDDSSPSAPDEFLLAAREGRTDVALSLLGELGRPWEARSPHGETAAHWAASNDDVVLLAALLAWGCPADSANYRGTTPLYYAATKNARRACQALLVAGADPRHASGFSGLYPDQVAADLELQSGLRAARARIEGAIAQSPALHLMYRARRWGNDSLDKHLLEGRRHAIEWGEQWRPRPDLVPIATVPQAAGALAREWQEFRARVAEHQLGQLDPSVQCAYCGATGPGKRRCSRCRAVWFCGQDCQRSAWPLHKRLGCPQQ